MAGGGVGNTLQPASRARSAGKYGMKRAEEEKEGRQGGRVTEWWAEVHNKFYYKVGSSGILWSQKRAIGGEE